MKYIDDCDSEKICKELSITPSNYWVILHRAKVQLRACLEKNWDKINVMNTDITCKKAVDLISKKEEGRLSTLQRFQLWKHLTVCNLCKRFSQQNKMFRKVSEFSDDRKLTEEDKKSIIDSVIRNTNRNL